MPAAGFDAARWIEIERLRLVYTNLPITLAVSVTSAVVLAALVRSVVPVQELLAWLSVGILVALLRYHNYRLFAALPEDTIDGARWRFRFELGAALSGLVWGYAAGIMFPAGALAHQMFIIFVMAGVSAGAMTSYSAIRRAYIVFILPALLPLVARLVFEQTDIHYAMAALALLFLGVVVRTAIETDRMIGNVLKVRAENVELTLALKHQATHDPLVDLVNHREFSDRLHAVAKASADRLEPYALLFVDLDDFKTVNDSAGHVAGDEMLRGIARILKEQIRPDDTAARLGGDEFAVLLQRCPRVRAEEIARGILDAIERFELPWDGGRVLKAGASIGIAYTDAGEYDAGAVLKAADSACYAAKNAGRGRIEVFHADPIYVESGRFRLAELRHGR